MADLANVVINAFSRLFVCKHEEKGAMLSGNSLSYLGSTGGMPCNSLIGYLLSVWPRVHKNTLLSLCLPLPIEQQAQYASFVESPRTDFGCFKSRLQSLHFWFYLNSCIVPLLSVCNSVILLSA